ncbi:MAG TPA: 4Fe-4S dicluster domain-containing protein [Planctomycetota bacterium]|nr:4Fe-4S dicluster domain-containing protein [Planctomycetota bacterium]
MTEDRDNSPDAMVRRTFLKLLGTGVGLAGLEACTGRLPEKIVPYVQRPREETPGIPRFFATSAVLDGFATGLVVETHDGRPTKIEGNPEHPASLGAAGVHEQALLLQLYDPCRARIAHRRGAPVSFDGFRAACQEWKGVHFLLEPTGSPLIAELLSKIPGAVVHFRSALETRGPSEARRRLLGKDLVPRLDFARARRILALDADFLAAGPFHLRHARDFAATRTVEDMSRLYVVEPCPTPTGLAADHRLARRARDVELVGRAVLDHVLELMGDRRGIPALALRSEDAAFARACARDLWAHRGRALVVAGERQSRGAHAVAILLNELLGGAAYSESPLLVGEPLPTRAETLVVMGGNPGYSWPDFAELAANAKTTVYVGLYEDETARLCDWFLPRAHVLESWGDARARDGTVSTIQPVIAPLHGGRSAAEVLSCFVANPPDPASLYSRETLARGFVQGSALPLVSAPVRWEAAPALLAKPTSSPGIELVFAPDPAVHDGSFANNPWLLELPDPTTKLTWEKAALLGPATARELGVATEHVLSIARGRESIEIPAFVVPGHAEGSITLPLGYGRKGAEKVAAGLGVNAFPLAGSDGFATASRVERVLWKNVFHFPPRQSPKTRRLATTQHHDRLEGRKIVEETTLAQVATRPHDEKLPVFREGPQWAMTIDLSKCTGCNACVLGCQAENNVPVVGMEGVLQGREMHWLRLDRYVSGADEDPRFSVEPMLCQHCEKAPCEYVCPVNATTHSPDGLNEQTYNRCIGTRFCSNNCPYKVRRFNWFAYTERWSESERLALNPDVTIRQRGVMEKCTFCVQRIREKEIKARIEGREVRDGEVQTACQQACPSRAIVFGSIADPGSRVARTWTDPRRYAVLEELGTLPRVQYLARVRNPNPELET